MPSPAQLDAAIKQFTPGSDKWEFIAQAISTVWANYYPQVKGNPKLALSYLEAIASGCEDAARPFIGPIVIIGPPITPQPTFYPGPDFSPPQPESSR